MQAKSTIFIAYYRVSTDKQGKSGLGLEAQRAAVAHYLGSVGGTLRAEFTEVETGKRNDRPELEKALAACRKRQGPPRHCETGSVLTQRGVHRRHDGCRSRVRSLR